jgi:RNA polymerase primary sigma factor
MVAEKIDQILSVLTSLQSQVIRLRFGLSDGFAHTLDEVAGRLGISPARVREIEIEVIEFLQSSKPQDEPR